jgi:ubiquinone/menaquinone biosynthesis C-methylase UbiE
MRIDASKSFLKNRVEEEFGLYFGVQDKDLVNAVTNEWFDESHNSDGRWSVIKDRDQAQKKILDLAAGCGTFLLFGLNHGYNVWGVEPEHWKLDFFREKIISSGYPSEFLKHMIEAKGESLPFKDNSFDLITSYQTLEHVKSVSQCLREMIRVLKTGGVLYLKCPDYNSFYEPHYQLPFLPTMNKVLAKKYLDLLGRPTAGLKLLQWTTEKNIIKEISNISDSLKIERMTSYYADIRKSKIEKSLPTLLRQSYIINSANYIYEIMKTIRKVTRIFSEEAHVDLWITKY